MHPTLARSASFAGRLWTEQQKEIACEIADAQSGEVSQCKERQAKVLAPWAERRIEQDPKAGDEENRVNHVHDEGAQTHSELAGIAKIRRPPDRDQQHRNE